MSAGIYATMSTDDLVQRFADTAKRAGSVWSDVIPKPTPENKELVRQMQAMGEELRARKPIAQLRRLFEDESRDVRAWSAAQFSRTDPEWADATYAGLRERLTVREVLALRQRVLAGPPPAPPATEATVEELIDRFEDACIRLYATTRFLTEEEGGDMTMIAYNHVVGESEAIAKELAARGRLDALVPLLDHSLVTVRERAAIFCLPVARDRAIATLEAIEARKIWPEEISAWETLKDFPDRPRRTEPPES